MLRRDFLYGLGSSLGCIAFTSMLADTAPAPADTATKKPHFPQAKAKHCIFLYMEGGPSHIDTFDPKPALSKLHEKEFHRSGEQQSAMSSGKRYYLHWKRRCKCAKPCICVSLLNRHARSRRLRWSCR
ncbi:MAG: DUF1501 domain-containing protein [Planctomycetes bacterium]|nr:DUF1501 domain-containing protein [Planctomycetota bacterium]